MTDDRFTELLNGPLNHPRTAFFMLRLANALEGRRDGGSGGGKDCGHLGLREANETLHHSRIELRAARFDEAANGLLVRKANAVGA